MVGRLAQWRERLPYKHHHPLTRKNLPFYPHFAETVPFMTTCLPIIRYPVSLSFTFGHDFERFRLSDLPTP